MARLQPWFKKKIKKKICSTDDPKIKVHLTDLPVGFGYKGKHTIRIISHIHTNTAHHVYASFPWGKSTFLGWPEEYKHGAEGMPVTFS